VDQGRPALSAHRTRARWGTALRGWRGALAAALPLAFFAVFFAYPVGSVLVRGLDGRGRVHPGDVLGDATTWRIVWFTTWQAAVSTVLTLAAGLPAAWAVARHEFRGRALVRALVVVPFVMPTVVIGAALRSTFSRFGLDGGAVNLDQSIWAILIAHVIFNVAVVVRVVGGYWAVLDVRLVESARVLGATRRTVWREVTLPHLKPALWSAATIVFLFCFTSFGVILVVGGPRHATLETEIWRYATQRTDFTTAAVLACVQLAFVVTLVVASSRAERLAAQRAGIRRARRAPRPRTIRQKALVATIVMVTLGVLLLPLAVLIERSLAVGDGYGFAHYRALTHRDERRALLVPPIDAVRNSLITAVEATGIALVIGGMASFVVVNGRRLLGRVLDAGLMVPLGTSAVTLGFGILIALDEPPLDLRTSQWIVPIAQAVVGVPFVMRAVVPMLRAIDDRLREAAATLGASPDRVRREIDLPIVRRALAAAAGFAFAVSLGEFGATTFLARPDRPTVPIAMFRLLSQPGTSLRGQAMALGVVLTLITVVCVVLIERAQRGHRVGW
jgi:thiamine transport system permease protein